MRNLSIATVLLLALTPTCGARPAAAQQLPADIPAAVEALETPTAAEPSPAAAAPSTEEKLKSLATELSQVAATHGPDAVTLQVGLLVQAMQAGAVDATEVRVVGPSPDAGETYLRIALLSGIIFDSDTTTPTERARAIWRDVAAPAIRGLEKFETEPANLELVVDYGLQSFASLPERRSDPTVAYEHRSLRFELPVDVVAECLGGAAADPGVPARCRVFDADRRIEP